MFEHRVKVFLSILGVATAVIVARLAELQIARGGYYHARAERALALTPRQVAFVRGSILDRTGDVLVSDEPSWEIKIDYDVISADVGQDTEALSAALRRWKRRYSHLPSTQERERAFRAEVASMWRTIVRQPAPSPSPLSIEDLRARAGEIYRRVRRIKEAVTARRGFDTVVAEEKRGHAIVTDLDSGEQITAREELADYPWIEVVSASKRSIHGDAAAFAHVLGRLGRVDASVVANDPLADDPFAKYLADERLGISGAERIAESVLRGRRGQVTYNKAGELDGPIIEAENGRDVSLSIHAALQRRIYNLLGEAVEKNADSCGGAIVVLDVPSREVLALVSYPSYDPARFRETYSDLRDDTDRLPLRFRAVANRYAPGSIIKPLVCLAGLMSGEITIDSREECTGYLLPEYRDRWRCWAIHGTSVRKAHGHINVVEALTGSCNVFMYRLGEKLGANGLCSAFDMFGVGRGSGTGLREEAIGINPTPGWLMRHKGTRVQVGHGRLFAIGQGELAMTPVQVANLFATYASGIFRPVTLLRTATPSPQWTIPATDEQWRAIRKGIYGVVNDPGGTAHKHAMFVHDRYALCGKTGSATAIRWPTAFRVPYVDEHGVSRSIILRAGVKREAVDTFVARYPNATFDPAAIEVAAKWPPNPPPSGERYSHAWFGGYLQALDNDGRPDWSRIPRVAFAILIEFGGSGGRTSGPLANKLSAQLLEVLGDDLETDATSPGGHYP